MFEEILPSQREKHTACVYVCAPIFVSPRGTMLNFLQLVSLPRFYYLSSVRYGLISETKSYVYSISYLTRIIDRELKLNYLPRRTYNLAVGCRENLRRSVSKGNGRDIARLARVNETLICRSGKENIRVIPSSLK